MANDHTPFPRTGRAAPFAPLVPALLAAAIAVAPARADWPMLGGSPNRNMASPETGLALSFDEEDGSVRWSAKLGSQTFGNPVVSDGRVYIGTNNGNPRSPEIEGDKGVLMCFAAGDGSFLWQAVHDKLPTGDAEDWAQIGICSTPCVVGDRVYYVSNRCELVACDARGFRDDENDGPLTGEKRKGKEDADFVWILDMRGELGVTPFQASASSPVVVGDLVFVVTGQGVSEPGYKVKNPKAPSFLAVDRHTGKVVWSDASPGERILDGQWGSPAYGVVDGKPQVAFPGGDGWIYAFEPRTGELLWKFDCKTHEKKSPDDRGLTSSHIVATPVYHGHRVLIAIGPNPEAGGGPGALRAIDARKRKDITGSGAIWALTGSDFGASISTVAVHDGLVYAVQLDGFLDCIDLETGKRVWRHDLLAYVWGSPVVADGRVYVRNEDGDVVVLATGREKKVLATSTLPGLYHGTVTPCGGVLYLAGEDRLYAVAPQKAK